MPEQSSMHFYLNWAKERIDEMDAALASFEVKAGQVEAASKAKAAELIAGLKKQRDEFRDTQKRQAEAGEAALERGKTELESQWKGFEALVETYIDAVGKRIEQQKVTFQDVAAVQVKAWREAAGKIEEAASKLAVEQRTHVDAAVKQLKADASEAEARLQKLQQAGSESWAGLSAALAESRKAFDHANQAAWDAVKRATSSKA